MRSQAHYGIDGPHMFYANLILGGVFAFAAAFCLKQQGQALFWLGLCAAAFATLLFALAEVMLWSSLIGKMRVRDRLVAALALSGPEHVLDAGCGRGLALLACANKLSTGKAVGIDLWAARDLSNNNPEATVANAVREGVAARVEVQTGDITRMPFPDETFDAVISMTVIHNIPSKALRDQALRELVRVLKPGGRLALYDLLHTSRYAEVLRSAGMTVRDIGRHRLWLMSGRSLLAFKPSL